METTESRITESGGFLEEVEGKADWREYKAREYPDDERNQASADALRALAEWIMAHGESAVVERLNQALDRLYADVDTTSDLSADMHNHLSRHGFCNGQPEAPEVFLGKLVKDIEGHLLTRRRFSPTRDGHAPGHLREALYNWIDDQNMEGGGARLDDEESFAVNWLLGQLWNCSDTLPSHIRARLGDFGIEAGSVAAAVRAIKRQRTE